MKAARICSRCKTELPSQAPEGLCPRCLLKAGAAELGLAFSGGREPGPGFGGQRFGNFELLEKIGEGGMGVVYRARQVNLNRMVAVKLLPPGPLRHEDAVGRFRAEASAVATLRRSTSSWISTLNKVCRIPS